MKRAFRGNFSFYILYGGYGNGVYFCDWISFLYIIMVNLVA